MATQAKDHPDLRLLSRGLSVAPASEPRADRIPPPRFNWTTRVALPTGLLVAVALLLGYTARDALLPATPVRVVPVVVKSTTESSVASVVQAPGWVEADPYPISVPALTDGVVKDVLVLEGQPVKKGDVVVRLVDDDARLELARAEAELADAQAELEAAQRNWDHPVERTRALASAEGMVAEIQAELLKNEDEVAAEAARADVAATVLKRKKDMFEHNAATELEFVEAELEFQSRQATLRATQARRPVLEAQLKQRQAELDAARKNLELRIEETRELASAKAALALAVARRDEARLRLERTEVRSPADGIVMNRFVEPGAKLVMGMDDMHSAHAVRLFDPQRLQVRVDVPLADAAKVGVGQKARIVVGVLPDKTFDGEVTRIVNEADVQKNTLQVKVAITNPSSELKPEMLARVRFLVPQESGGGGTRTAQLVFAPENLIQRTDAGAKVWIADTRRGVATLKDITLGQTRQDGWISVTAGLHPGDVLIADPARVSEGTKVTVQHEGEEAGEPSKGGARDGAH